MSLGLPDYLRLGAGVVTLLRQKTAYDTANQDAIASLRTSDQEIELIGLNRIRQQEAINSQVAAEAIKKNATKYDLQRSTRASVSDMAAQMGSTSLSSGSYDAIIRDLKRDGLEVSQRHEQNFGFRLQQLERERTDVELNAAGLVRKSRSKVKAGGSEAGLFAGIAGTLLDTGLQVGFTTDPNTGKTVARSSL
jgi:hypothetical protein|tara:strand:+ start:25 stop:603 length:579 start_codon:yes stop_codon:yes gene_type:complete